MKTRAISKIASILCLSTLTIVGYAQTGQAKVTIKKNNNGTETETTEYIEIPEGQNLEKLLVQMDIWEQFESLDGGQTIELQLKKMLEDGENADLSIMYLENAFPSICNKPMLGVRISAGNEGVKVVGVIPGTPAEASGIQENDEILSVNGERVVQENELIAALNKHKAGDTVTLLLKRDTETLELKVDLAKKSSSWNEFWSGSNLDSEKFDWSNFGNSGEMDKLQEQLDGIDDSSLEGFFQAEEKPFLGVGPADNQGGNGMKIGVVTPNSAAAEMGLQGGDDILSINGKPTPTFEQLAAVISELQVNDKIEIEIQRDGSKKTLIGAMGKREGLKYGGDNYMFEQFKGMDEEGVYHFDFEIDTSGTNGNLDFFNKDVFDFNEKRFSNSSNFSQLAVVISIESISPQEIETLNERVNEPLSIEDNLELETIAFFPNPSKGLVQLNFETKKTGSLSIKMYDAAGNIVFDEKRPNFSGNYREQIDIAGHPNGVYYLQIRMDDKTYSKKLVKS